VVTVDDSSLATGGFALQPNWLAWSEGRRPPDAESALMEWVNYRNDYALMILLETLAWLPVSLLTKDSQRKSTHTT